VLRSRSSSPALPSSSSSSSSSSAPLFSIILSHLQFLNSSSRDGGAIRIQCFSNTSFISIYNSSFAGNSYDVSAFTAQSVSYGGYLSVVGDNDYINVSIRNC